MTSNHQKRTQIGINQNGGHIIAGNLMDAFKQFMLEDNVMCALFGDDGKRIFINDVPSYNETIVPLFEMYWNTENFVSNTAYYTGTVLARIVLPTNVQGKLQDMRRVGAIFQRFLGSRLLGEKIFPAVLGLTAFGDGADFNYSKVLTFTGFSLPFIEITLPFTVDMMLLTSLDENYDNGGALDSDDLGFIETITIKIEAEDDNNNIVQEIEVEIETGQTN